LDIFGYLHHRKEIRMHLTEPESPSQEGVSSRIFPSTASSIDQVRDFLEERLQAALRPAGPVRDQDVPSSLHLSIRVLPDHIQVTVGDQARDVGFREWLAAALHGASMSQETAARRLGVSLKTVNRWLRGHSEPRMRELRRVREVFGDPPLS
jgi:DNA-binding XRE family transcriptional regulator